MIQNHKGITLFECLVYLALFSFIALSGMLIVARLWQSGIEGAAFERSSLTVYSTFDILAREIECAPVLRETWKHISPTMLIWPIAENKDRGWLFEKGKLLRIEGKYHPSSGQWHPKNGTLVAPLTRVSFSCQGTTHLSRVEVQLSDKITSLKEIIYLQNRGPF